MKSVKKGLREILVAGRDGAIDLEVSDHELDTGLLLVDVAVPADPRLAIGARRDHGPKALRCGIPTECIAVEALVGEKMRVAVHGPASLHRQHR